MIEVSPTETPSISGDSKPRRFSPSRAFLVLAFFFGTVMALLVPPYQVPDEPAHLLRAYQISEGHFVSTWKNNLAFDDLPESIVQSCDPFVQAHLGVATTSFAAIRQAMRIPLSRDKLIPLRLETAHYSPIGYLPQVIGIWIGRVCNWPPIVLLYLGRLTNLWIWIALGYHALRIAPHFARPMFLLMLMPMSLFMAASISPDAITNGVAFIVAALAFNAVEKKVGDDSKIGWPWITEFILCSAALSLIKVAYLPLAGLIFAIPVRRFGGAKRFLFVLFLLGILAIVPETLWSRTTPGVDIITYVGDPYVNGRRQFDFLLQHPGSFVRIPFFTARRSAGFLILSFVGRLGWLNIQLPVPFILTYLILLILACRRSTSGAAVINPRRVIAVAAIFAAASCEALFLLLSIIWTPVGQDAVEGLQGRYFIPIAPAVLLIAVALWGYLPDKFRSRKSESARDLTTAAVAFLSCAYTVTVLYMHYFVSANFDWI